MISAFRFIVAAAFAAIFAALPVRAAALSGTASRLGHL